MPVPSILLSTVYIFNYSIEHGRKFSGSFRHYRFTDIFLVYRSIRCSEKRKKFNLEWETLETLLGFYVHFFF